MRLIYETFVVSGSISTDSMTPNTGVIKLYIVTFDTELYFKSIPHTAYATAESAER